MGKLGTQVMAAGARDLNAGAAFLDQEAQKAKVKVISANLRQGEKAPFPASAVITVGGVKVGLVGLSPPGPLPGHPELKGLALSASAKPELEKLKGKVDVLVLLAPVRYADALQLGQELKGLPDFIFQSGEFHSSIAAQLLDGGAYLTGSGQRGQVLGKLELKLDGKGPFKDLSEAKRDQQELDHLESQVKQLQEREAKITDPVAKKDFERTFAEIKARRDQQKAKVATAIGPEARTLNLDWVILDQSRVDDPALKAEVLKIEPTYAGSH